MYRLYGYITFYRKLTMELLSLFFSEHFFSGIFHDLFLILAEMYGFALSSRIG
jgi:hypothetical protein